MSARLRCMFQRVSASGKGTDPQAIENRIRVFGAEAVDERRIGRVAEYGTSIALRAFTKMMTAKRFAFHEAGHAVVGTSLGFRIRSVWIAPRKVPRREGDANGQTEGIYQARSIRAYVKVRREDAFRQRSDEEIARYRQREKCRDIIYSLAGAFSEGAARGMAADFEGAGGDNQLIEETLAMLLPNANEERREAFMQEAYRQTLRLVIQLWPAIEAVAGTLERRLELRGGEVRRLHRLAMNGRRVRRPSLAKLLRLAANRQVEVAS